MIKLFNEDCLIVMEQLIQKNKKVDAIITDAPYLISYKTNHRKDKNHLFTKPINNDDNFDFQKWAYLANILLKDNTPIYFFTSWKTEPYFRNIFKTYWNHKNNIIWKKNNWSAGDLQTQYGNQYELISLYNKGRNTFQKKRYPDIWEFDRVVGKYQLHQNQKPEKLIERIVENSTEEKHIVLDPFMGSGTTGLICKNLNRSFIGIEIDEYYFNIAKERIFNE